MIAHDVSESLAEVLAQASASIVRVAGRRRYALSGTLWGDGLIVTTSRAVEGDAADVTFAAGETVSATVVGRDVSTDLAVLKVETPFDAPTWADAGQLRVGQLALVAGRPAVLEASLGFVGALGGPWRTAFGGRVTRLIRVDARPFPGFSGGPLLSASGEILGVNTAALSRDAPATLPTETVRRVLETLRTHGRMRRGYLGITGQPVRLSEAQGAPHRGAGSLLVTSVEDGGPAADAGLVVGDIVLSLGGESVRHPAQLAARLDEETVGQALAVTLLRGGQQLELSVTVAERP